MKETTRRTLLTRGPTPLMKLIYPYIAVPIMSRTPLGKTAGAFIWPGYVLAFMTTTWVATWELPLWVHLVGTFLLYLISHGLAVEFGEAAWNTAIRAVRPQVEEANRILEFHTYNLTQAEKQHG